MKTYSIKLNNLKEKLATLFFLIDPFVSPVFTQHLSGNEINTLKYLSIQGPLSMKELAELVGVKPNVMTSIVSGLIKQEMILRLEGNDRRMIMIDLIPKWKQAYEMFNREHEKIAQTLIEAIGDKQFDLLAKSIAKTIEKLQETTTTIKRTV